MDMSVTHMMGTILVFGLIGLMGLVLEKRLPLPYSLILVVLGFGVSFLLSPCPL